MGYQDNESGEKSAAMICHKYFTILLRTLTALYSKLIYTSRQVPSIPSIQLQAANLVVHHTLRGQTLRYLLHTQCTGFQLSKHDIGHPPVCTGSSQHAQRLKKHLIPLGLSDSQGFKSSASLVQCFEQPCSKLTALLRGPRHQFYEQIPPMPTLLFRLNLGYFLEI